VREVGDDADKRAPGGIEREREGWRVGPAGLGFSRPDGCVAGPWRKETGGGSWAGLGRKVER